MTTTRVDLLATDGLQRTVREKQSCTRDWDHIEQWIKTVRAPRGLQRLDGAKVAAGRELFLSGSGVKDGACADCHGGSGWTLSSAYYTIRSTQTAKLAAAPFDPDAPWPSVWNQQTRHIEAEQPGGVGPLHASCVIRNLVGDGALSTFGPAALERKNPGQAVAQGAQGYNIPALYGLALGAPYLHHGQARTLRELFDNVDGHLKAGNDNFSPSSEDKDALVEYLLSIDGDTPEVEVPAGFDKCVEFRKLFARTLRSLPHRATVILSVDQRRTLRIATDLPARCRSATRFVAGRVRNLSQGGIMFVVASHEHTPASNDVALEIDLPDGDGPLTLEGEICWRADIGASGIRITNIPLPCRRRLANWILRTHQGDFFAD